MNKRRNNSGFSLLEVLIAVAIFLLFALGVYGGVSLVFKVVYMSRTRILETVLISEELEVVRALPYESVGILDGIPPGVLSRNKTVVRNGQSFDIITTVRNIDDNFDGTVGGIPNDTSPADYKLVEISAICSNCLQTEPVILSTVVSPKQLEGASENGHLFIQVFGATGLPVSGANVHVVNTARTPHTIIDDVTGNDGWLRIVDTTTGTLSYDVSVSKPGYSLDGTVAPSITNPNPIKPPANVAAQTVTEIFFAIDQLGSINLHTLNANCSALGGKTINLQGEKMIGIEPDVYKFSQTVTTDGSGNYLFSDLEWDRYMVSAPGTSYDVAGTVPMVPVDLQPGVNQEMSVILKPHTSYSLLVNVLDAATKLPVAEATVRLSGNGYDETLSTGVGYLNQTDWSGGSGQDLYITDNKYWSDDGRVSVTASRGDIKLKKSGSYYQSSGYLESSTFDAGEGVQWRNIVSEPFNQPSQCGSNAVRLQVATSNSSTPASWSFVGPDGTGGSYYTSVNTVLGASHAGSRYLRYRVYLSTNNTKYTPTVSDVSFTYTNSCTPPGQAFFNSLAAGTYNLETSQSGYDSSSGEIVVDGNNEAVVNLSVSA